MSSLFVYSDESGVLDYRNQFYVFSGILFLEKEKMENAGRLFLSIENNIKKNKQISGEMKGAQLSYKNKLRIIKAINEYSFPFIVQIDIQKINKNIFNHKKTKQRFLDYAYKIGLKKALVYLHNHKQLNLDEVTALNIYLDQHTTATDGIYELKESILQEFKIGIFNFNTNTFFEPICPNIEHLHLNYYNSQKKALIRVADIFANYYFGCIKNTKKPYKDFFVCELP